MFSLYCSEMGRNYKRKKYDVSSFVAAVERYFEDHIRIYDADICDDETYYFAVHHIDTGEEKFFKLEYSWYIDYTPDWELIDARSITEVKKEETTGLVSDRDWLIV